MPADSETAATGLSRKRRQTRDRLLNAALDAFAERGLHGTSVEDICDRAGFTRGAFYSNFHTKDELFLALQRQQAARVLAAITAAATPPLEGNVEDTVRRIVEAIPHDPRWFLVNTEFLLHAVRDPAAAAALAEHRATLRGGVAALVEATVARHGHRLDVDVDDLVRAVLALYDGSLAQHYIEPERHRPGALLHQFLPRLLRLPDRA